MEKKIFYWSPHINKEVATVKAVLNSAYSLTKFSKKFKPYIINVFGEWDDFSEQFKEFNINSIKIFNFKINLPINGYIKSRLFYIFLSIATVFPLIRLIKKDKPDYVIIHLITIPVLIVSFFLKRKTKFILRISGYPKLNFLRSYFWKLSSKNLYKIFTPTSLTKQILIKNNIFKEEKIFILEDPIIQIRKIAGLKREKITDLPKNLKYIISIGRLTKQKNFTFLINSFAKIKKKLDNIKLIIIGSGEEYQELDKLINTNHLQEDIYLMEYKKNIFNYLSKSILFILSSNWEDPGFVIIEAAICNKLILSSDVESGPREFLDSQKNGLLFEKNNYEDFEKKLKSFFNLDTNSLFKKKLSAKKRAKNYTIFNHFNKLENFLSD